MESRRLPRARAIAVLAGLLTLGPAGTAWACGGLVAPNGTVNLLRTTTLAAYHDGVEHYITAFDYAGVDAKEVGSIVPLPGVPTQVIKAGDWTLQRLELEVQPPEHVALTAAAAPADAQVLLTTTVEALDITVLKGGAVSVGNWARDHGFFLPPDAPKVLDFYAQRSPIFMAVRFNAARADAQGVQQGQGTPVDVVIPTPHPWVPLRILTLGQQPSQLVQADVFLLTDREPAMLPQTVSPNGNPKQIGLIRQLSEPASSSLLADLRRDQRMSWVPDHMWLTYVKVKTPASALTYDLAVDASGFGRPDPVAAGLQPPAALVPRVIWPGLLGGGLLVTLLIVVAEAERRRVRHAAV